MLTAGGAPANHAHGCLRVHSRRDERRGDLANAFHAHEHDFGAGDVGDGIPVDGSGFLRRIFVPGDDGEAGAMIAVRERNARVVRRSHDGGNAGHDFEMDFRRREFLGLFAAAPENVGVAALEAHDGFAFLRFRDEELV